MKARGVMPGDIITVCTNNTLNSCIPYLASFFLGAIVSALDPTISTQDKKMLLEQVKPKMIFAIPECVDEIDKVLRDESNKTEIVVFGETNEHNSFVNFLQPSVEDEHFVPYKIENIFDTAAIFFSSGTTGLPKGICLSHYALLRQAAIFNLSGFESEVALAFSTLYWISAAVFLFNSILTGTARLMAPEFNALETWQYIDRYRVTLLFMAPSQAMAIMKLGRPDNLNTTSLLDTVIGGGPTSSENLLAFRDLLPGTNVFQGYGQTELAGILTVFKPNLRKDVLLMHAKPGSCGRPVIGTWYKIVDLETEETLGPNQPGEIRIKAKHQMNGYYKKDSSDTWDADGWLKTGDVGYYDEDHCFYIVDRIKEMLKFQSWHVPPALLEGILLEHPCVKTAVVIGIPHEEDGDHPLGLVVLSEHARDIDPEDLQKYVAERVDDRKRLRAGVKFITDNDIPYTATGKVKRKLLREKILTEMF